MIKLVYVGNKVKGEALFYIYDVCLDSGEVVGECNLRVGGDNFYSGNVGYRINEEYRNRGYATAAVEEIKKLAAQKGIDELLLCIAPDNAASLRVAKKLGAVDLGETDIPESHELYAYGRRKTSRHLINLKPKTEN